MATAIDFEQRNDYIGKPDTMSNNQCYALPVCRVVSQIPGVIPRAAPQPKLAHISCWELTSEEMVEIQKTGKVYLWIMGVTLPPLSIHGKMPVFDGDVILTEEQIEKAKNHGSSREDFL